MYILCQRSVTFTASQVRGAWSQASSRARSAPCPFLRSTILSSSKVVLDYKSCWFCRATVLAHAQTYLRLWIALLLQGARVYNNALFEDWGDEMDSEEDIYIPMRRGEQLYRTIFNPLFGLEPVGTLEGHTDTGVSPAAGAASESLFRTLLILVFGSATHQRFLQQPWHSCWSLVVHRVCNLIMPRSFTCIVHKFIRMYTKALLVSLARPMHCCLSAGDSFMVPLRCRCTCCFTASVWGSG